MCGMVPKMCGMVPKMCGMVPEMCARVSKMCGMVPKMCGMVAGLSAKYGRTCVHSRWFCKVPDFRHQLILHRGLWEAPSKQGRSVGGLEEEYPADTA